MFRGFRKKQRVPLRRWGALALGTAACADLLAIESGTPRDSCVGDSECTDDCIADTCAGASAKAPESGRGGVAEPCRWPEQCNGSGAGGNIAVEGGAGGSVMLGGGAGGQAGQAGDGGTPVVGSGGDSPSGGGDGGAGGNGLPPHASAGAAGEGASGGDAACENDALACDTYRPLACASGNWAAQAECSVHCREGKCVSPPSCEQIPLCRDQSSCCETIWVPGGTYFMRSNDPETGYRRAVSGFYLDRFEVTVGRFARFAGSYGPSHIPAAGAGAHPRIANSGWDAAWEDAQDSAGTLAVPRTSDELIAQVTQDKECAFGDVLKPSDIPMTCVNWYVAFAFCIWDGGRLPTEAEWNYAASAGKGYSYPWSRSESDTTITQDHARYGAGGATPVGSFPKGRGAFERRPALGHDDLAGNVWEWLADGVDPTMPREEMLDFMVPWDPLNNDRMLAGGGFDAPARELDTGSRIPAGAADSWPSYGFRCARDRGLE